MNLSQIKVENRTIYFRDGTSDSLIINKNLGQTDKPEYMFPVLPITPKVILDIGGNIGITALVLNKRYPSAKIYTFEPEPENFSILEKNVSGISNIEIFNFGLSNSDQKLMLKKPSDPVNFGGFSVFDKGVNGDHQEIELKSISQFIEQKEILKIDVIKIDCEGAEYDILTSLDLSNITWIEGECHGIKDFELLSYINKTHVLNVDKPLLQRNFGFQALNKVYVAPELY